MINFSIIIATCGRPESLAAALDCVRAAAESAGGAHEIIVVDNHPDGTARGVVERGPAAPAEVRYLASRPRDKAAALNAGIAAARHGWLAFTDDDTLPDPAWLREGARVASRGEFRVFGGRVVAGIPDRPLPRWLAAGRSGRVPQVGALVAYDPAPSSGRLAPGATVPFGANIFVSRPVFAQHGGYDEGLWALCGRRALGAEDSEFGIRLVQRGEPIGYCREAVVVHPVRYDRCTLRSHLRLAYDYGWREPIVCFTPGQRLVEAYRLKLLARLAWRAAVDAARGDPAGAVDDIVRAVRCVGEVAGRLSPAYRRRASRAALL